MSGYRHYHAGRRGGYDEFAWEGDMPPSSQTSYGDDHFDRSHHTLPERPQAHRDLPERSRPRYPSRSPPRAPRAMRDESRSSTPPPPTTPSPAYLTLSEQSPSRVDEPALSRKLLVLDLNGTLLLRAPHNHRPKPKQHPGQPRERPQSDHGAFVPRLRPVHPRPYMSAFRRYLFAPRTKEWLDVMVWSSAQPHSVGDMVHHCFGESKERLLAVWARDTLGLSDDHYHRKVQTVKDLEKPWALLSPKPTMNQSSPSHHSDSIASTPNSASEPPSPKRNLESAIDDASPQAHSALTTLLLDDSPRKAELQPFNHVCIGEYTGEQRAKDLESLQKEQDWKAAVKMHQELAAAMAENPKEESLEAEIQDDSQVSFLPGSSPEASAVASGGSSKKRKRKKKLEKRAARLEQIGQEEPQVSYDETLLAVIGVLDEIKKQANVAAWIRSGGLGSSIGSSTVADAESVEVNSSPPAVSLAAADNADVTHSDDSDLSVDNGPPPTAASAPRRNRKKRKRVAEPTADVQVDDGAAIAANGQNTAVPVSSVSVPSEAIEDSGSEESQKMWFENSAVVAYWTSRGRTALEELSITIEHGIER